MALFLAHVLRLVALFFCLQTTTALAGTSAVITHLSGTLVVARDGTQKLLAVNSEVREGDTLTTQHDTYARMKFADGAEVVLRPNSEFRVDAYSFNAEQPSKDNFVVSLLKGGFRAVTGLLGKRNKEKASFNTPTATIGIRGTHFGSLLCNNDCSGIPTISGRPPENGLHLDVVAGSISVRNSAGNQNIESGQFGYVRDSNIAPALVPPDLGIQITIPPSISSNRAGGRSVGPDENVECSP